MQFSEEQLKVELNKPSPMDLRKVDLSGANLYDAHLNYADLTGASLRDTFKRGTDLRHALLYNADLTGAQMGGSSVIGAKYDKDTKWPVNINPKRSGAILVDE
jgi:uncharacterized protein YjbI with pentapeptide repeats